MAPCVVHKVSCLGQFAVHARIAWHNLTPEQEKLFWDGVSSLEAKISSQANEPFDLGAFLSARLSDPGRPFFADVPLGLTNRLDDFLQHPPTCVGTLPSQKEKRARDIQEVEGRMTDGLELINSSGNQSLGIFQARHSDHVVIKSVLAKTELALLGCRVEQELQAYIGRADQGVTAAVFGNYFFKTEKNWEAYCEMQKITGWSLAEVFEHMTQLDLYLSLGAATYLLASVMRHLCVLDELQVEHGDAHDGNIMIDEDGSVYLIDFGHTRLASTAKQKLVDALRAEVVSGFDFTQETLDEVHSSLVDKKPFKSNVSLFLRYGNLMFRAFYPPIGGGPNDCFLSKEACRDPVNHMVNSMQYPPPDDPDGKIAKVRQLYPGITEFFHEIKGLEDQALADVYLKSHFIAHQMTKDEFSVEINQIMNGKRKKKGKKNCVIM